MAKRVADEFDGGTEFQFPQEMSAMGVDGFDADAHLPSDLLAWTLDPNGISWSDPETFPNSRAFRFTGLTRGKDVWVRVRARNTIGAGPWSDPATIMVT